MKKKILLLLLLLPMLFGCKAKDLTDYHLVNESWIISSENEFEYEVIYKDFNDESVTLAIRRIFLAPETDLHIWYDKDIKFIDVDGERYTATMIPYYLPWSEYDVSLDKEESIITFYFSDRIKVFNRYVKADINFRPRYGLITVYGISLSLY